MLAACMTNEARERREYYRAVNGPSAFNGGPGLVKMVALRGRAYCIKSGHKPRPQL